MLPNDPRREGTGSSVMVPGTNALTSDANRRASMAFTLARGLYPMSVQMSVHKHRASIAFTLAAQSVSMSVHMSVRLASMAFTLARGLYPCLYTCLDLTAERAWRRPRRCGLHPCLYACLYTCLHICLCTCLYTCLYTSAEVARPRPWQRSLHSNASPAAIQVHKSLRPKCYN